MASSMNFSAFKKAMMPETRGLLTHHTFSH